MYMCSPLWDLVLILKHREYIYIYTYIFINNCLIKVSHVHCRKKREDTVE